MKRILLTAALIILAISAFAIIYVRQGKAGYNDVLKNGDFETGDFSEWSLGGVCMISSGTVHGGSYSAYVSDAVYDSWITQYVGLGANQDFQLQCWVYPLKVGSLGVVQYPVAYMELSFYNKSTMSPAFSLYYEWCWNDFIVSNSTAQLIFFVPFNSSTWNSLSRNVTQDIHSVSYYASVDLSELVLFSIHAQYHYSMASPGAFYLDDLKLLQFRPPPPQIEAVSWTPTCPPPYVLSNQDRVNEPVAVTANVTNNSSSLTDVLLLYRVNDGEWWNTTMTFNSTLALYTAQIPGQLGNSTVDFYIEAFDNTGNLATFPITTFNVKALPIGDLNGNGVVDLSDLVTLATHYGQHNP